MFHLSKGNTELGLKYLREASKEHENDAKIEKQLAMAIVATRHERGAEQITHARKQGPPRPDNQDQDRLLMNEYMWVLDENYDIAELKAEFEELKKQQLATTGNGTFNEWSYDNSTARDEIHEAGSPVHRYVEPERQAHEMEGDVHHVVRAVSHELSVEGSRSSRENGAEEEYSNTGPNAPQKKSRMPFKLSHRFKKGHGSAE